MIATASSRSLHAELRIDDVVAGRRRLTPRDALRLHREASLHDLGRWASAVCERIHGPEVRTYVIDRNINYTNVCSARCTFCAFRRDETDDDAYILSPEELHAKIAELVAIGGTQVLLQGGMHPGLGLDHYLDMLRAMKAAFPQVHIHGFSPPEFVEFVAVLELPGFPTTEPKRSHTLPRDVWLAKLEAVMSELRNAGLDSLPGGGGEVFAEHVRRRIGLGKATADQWLDVMTTAHKLGMKTSATMMFGHVEGVADRIDHMARVRARQDEARENDLPGGYLSFIAWPFQRENTPMGRLPDFDRSTGEPFPGDELADAVFEATHNDVKPRPRVAAKHADTLVPAAGKVVRMAGAIEYLRTQAVARLFLDNIHSIGSSWVTMGPRVGQTALLFGANDMGSVMMEENVVSAAGTTYCLTEPVLCHLIRDAGFTPAQRGNAYDLLQVHDGDDAPDRRVTDWSTQRAAALHQEGRPSDASPIFVTINGDVLPRPLP